MVARSNSNSAALTVLKGQLSTIADPDPAGAMGLVSMLDHLHEDPGHRLPPEVRQCREIIGNKLQVILETHEVHNAASRFLLSRTAAELRGGTQLWDELVADLGPSFSEPQRQALEVIKDNFIARKMQHHEQFEDVVTAVLREELAKALAAPDHEWRRQTWWEAFMEGLTNRESELARQGLAPLPRWQSFLNALGWDFADRRINAAKRERQQAFALSHGALEVIDAEAIG